MSLAYLDIEDKRIKSFEELKQLFDSQGAKNSGSRLYQLLIDMAVDCVLSDFLDKVGQTELAGKIRALDDQQTDLQIMNELQRIIFGDTVDINLNPLEYVKVLGTSISQCEQTVQTCFEIQIQKVAKEELLFSVVSETDRSEKYLNLENYRCGEIVKLKQELPIISKITFCINGKELEQRILYIEVSFQCEVQDASLYVDGQLLASSFPARLSLVYGRHDVRVHQIGYEDSAGQIMVDRRREYSIRLKKSMVSVGDILCTDDTTVPCSEWPVEGKTAKGVVFHVDDSGYHGWAVHLKDQGECVWATKENQKLVPGLNKCTSEKSALADVDGFSNREIVRSHVLKQTGTYLMFNYFCKMRFPALFAMDYANGWFLPACGQLKTLIDRQDIVNASLKKTGGELISNGDYWSSTQADENYAWRVNGSGLVGSHSKDYKRRVRAIRSF